METYSELILIGIIFFIIIIIFIIILMQKDENFVIDLTKKEITNKDLTFLDPNRHPSISDNYPMERTLVYAPLNEVKIESIIESNSSYKGSIENKFEDVSKIIKNKFSENENILLPNSQYATYGYEIDYPYGESYMPSI